MKESDIPQDPSPLDKFTKEVCYAVDANGNYTVKLSRGWQVKADALGITWQDVELRVADALNKIKAGEASPILYYMEVNMMDMSIISAYTGFWQWTIKRHLKPDVFKGLSNEKLKKYADIFEISVEELKNIKGI